MYFILSGFIDVQNLTREQSLGLGTLGIAVLIIAFSLLIFQQFSARISGIPS
jgi:hypothetical protein